MYLTFSEKMKMIEPIPQKISCEPEFLFSKFSKFDNFNKTGGKKLHDEIIIPQLLLQIQPTIWQI